MNAFFFVLVCSMCSLTSVHLGLADTPPPARAKSAQQQDRYTAYWLSKQGTVTDYRILLITRVPLAELPNLMEIEALFKGDPPPQLLERKALTITTYKDKAILNDDGVPIKPLTRFKNLNEKDRLVEVNGVPHRYEECSLADVVRLLDAPEGKEHISRIHPPLGGMEQTARALRLLIEEQMRDESKLPLPGGNASLPELVKACRGALVATLQSVGAPELGPPGASDYASKWTVERVLRGDYAKTADLSFRVQSLPEKSRETPPTVGKTYLLISYEANAGQIAVILEADEKNLRLLQDLLRQ